MCKLYYKSCYNFTRMHKDKIQVCVTMETGLLPKGLQIIPKQLLIYINQS